MLALQSGLSQIVGLLSSHPALKFSNWNETALVPKLVKFGAWERDIRSQIFPCLACKGGSSVTLTMHQEINDRITTVLADTLTCSGINRRHVLQTLFYKLL